MISFLNGILAEVGQDRLSIDVNGVGFEVCVSAQTAMKAKGIGEPVLLYTYLSVREDNMTLYGFLSKEELRVFKQLIAVTGIGPKGGLSILSAMSVDDLRFAILTSDAKAIARAPGVGKKTAERLVLELRDKFSADDMLTQVDGTAQDATDATGMSGAQEEAVAALCALGYGATDAMRAVRTAAKDASGNADTEALLKAALKELI